MINQEIKTTKIDIFFALFWPVQFGSGILLSFLMGQTALTFIPKYGLDPFLFVGFSQAIYFMTIPILLIMKKGWALAFFQAQLILSFFSGKFSCYIFSYFLVHQFGIHINGVFLFLTFGGIDCFRYWWIRKKIRSSKFNRVEKLTSLCTFTFGLLAFLIKSLITFKNF